MEILPCSTYSGILVICSRFTVCSLFQESETVVSEEPVSQMLAVSIVNKEMTAGLQSEPQSHSACKGSYLIWTATCQNGGIMTAPFPHQGKPQSCIASADILSLEYTQRI